jgi:hypothetical protein
MDDKNKSVIDKIVDSVSNAVGSTAKSAVTPTDTGAEDLAERTNEQMLVGDAAIAPEAVPAPKKTIVKKHRIAPKKSVPTKKSAKKSKKVAPKKNVKKSSKKTEKKTAKKSAKKGMKKKKAKRG